VVDLVVGTEAFETLLDMSADCRQLRKGLRRKLGEARRLTRRSENQGTERHLSGPKQHAPMLIAADEAIGEAKFDERAVDHRRGYNVNPTRVPAAVPIVAPLSRTRRHAKWNVIDRRAIRLSASYSRDRKGSRRSPSRDTSALGS